MNKTKIIVDACCRIKDAHLKNRLSKGKSACGVLIIDYKGEECHFKKYLGEMTVPEAEFRALVFALDKAVAVARYNVEVRMDSQLVVRWMNGEYRIKKDHIKPLFDEAKKYEQRFKDGVTYIHHSRDSVLGKRADKLAHDAYAEYQD